MKILLTGDSITAAGRDTTDPASLGDGYVALVADRLGDATVLNTGISGHRVPDLRERWDRDVLALAPDVLSVKIGVNDTWHRFTRRLRHGGTGEKEFEAGYREILDRSRSAGIGRIIVVEPFLLPVADEQWRMRADLDAKTAVVRRLAAEFDADLVALDGPFAEEASAVGTRALVRDGVHPTPAGHRLIADRWMRVFERGAR